MTTSSQQRVIQALENAGIAIELKTFPDGTRTAADAAAAIGCSVAEIAKSIVLRSRETNRVVLVVTSGINRVDEHKVAARLGEPLVKADAQFVREKTGFAIGGVAPVGHLEAPLMLIDEDLLQYPKLWAAGGTHDSVFALSPQQLLQLTGAPVAVVKVD